ncbi:MAG TPA: hypothetical protein PKE64_23555 [Anaerolineae bacterium]|nr:hypothetical protein [Anaerolineae bacterium]
MKQKLGLFILGFCGSLFIFLLLNLVAAHWRSDCGLMAVLGLSGCADDIVRLGFPWVVWEVGGFAYRAYLDGVALIADAGLTLGVSVVVGLVNVRVWR